MKNTKEINPRIFICARVYVIMEQFEGMEEKYIETNGIKLHTMIIGSGEPLLLIHGFPDFWYGWKNIIPGLKDKYRLIIPDMRGFNLSDKPEGAKNYEMKYILNDIKGLSEVLNLGKFNLAGHDWGGAAVWAFAAKYPELLNKLIAINAPHVQIMTKLLSTDDEQRNASRYMLTFRKPNCEKLLMAENFQAIRTMFFGNTIRKGGYNKLDEKKYIEAWSQPGALTGGLNWYRAPVTNFYGEIKVPTLVIHSMNDTYFTNKILEGLSDYVKDLKILRIENASHWIKIDAPEVVVSSIKEFIG